MVNRTAKTLLSALSRLLAPAAKLWARTGYFHQGQYPEFIPGKVAIVACHWLGDTFWASQVLPLLHGHIPKAEFFAITRPVCADLFHGLLPPERILAVPEVVSDRRRERFCLSAFLTRAGQLRQRKFDVVIDLTGNRFSALFTFLLRSRYSVGFDGGELGWLYSHRVTEAEPPGRHLSERPFRVVEDILGGFEHRLPLMPPKPTIDSQRMLERLNLSRPYCVIAPGAGWADKEWSVGNFARAGRELGRLGLRAVYVGSASQRELISAAADGVADALFFVGEPIGHVVGLLHGCDAVLSNDSGIAHLAAAMGKPVAAVFTGVTDPRLCRPLGERAAVFYADASVDDIVAHLTSRRQA